MKVLNDKTMETELQFDTKDIKRIFLDGELLKVEFKSGVVETIYEGTDARDELKRIRNAFRLFLPNFQPRTK